MFSVHIVYLFSTLPTVFTVFRLLVMIQQIGDDQIVVLHDVGRELTFQNTWLKLSGLKTANSLLSRY